MSLDDDNQQRIQDFGVDVEVYQPESEPQCERCGDELSDTQQSTDYADRLEYETEIRDVREEAAKLCESCEDEVRFLTHKYKQLTSDVAVSGAVAVYCDCHDNDEIDVQPIRRGESRSGKQCSRCGSGAVVVEELPPTRSTVAAISWGEML